MASYRLRLLSLLALASIAAATAINRRSDEYDDSSYTSGTVGTAVGANGVPLSQAALQARARLEAAVEKAHGVLGCLAFAFFFPVGAMLLRLLPGRLAVWLHAAWQIFAWFAALATLGMGVWMAKGTSYINTYHAIIGIFVIASVSLQPVTGFLHHLTFKKIGRRSGWSYAHMFFGIPVITLGTINGGFGLKLASASTTYLAVYGVFAALIWAAWMAVSMLAQIRRGASTPSRPKATESDTERMHSSDGRMDQVIREKEARNTYE